MTAVVTRVPHNPMSKVIPPTKADGTHYEWSVLLPGGSRYVWCDELPEAVAELVGVGDYFELADQEQFVARIRAALRLQVTTQARINAEAMARGDWWDALCEWERQVLNGPRHRAPNMPGGFPSRDLFGGVDMWTARTPLVVLTTAAEPLNPGVPPIVGTEDNLLVIDPIDDVSLLDSLHDIGVVRVFHHDG